MLLGAVPGLSPSYVVSKLHPSLRPHASPGVLETVVFDRYRPSIARAVKKRNVAFIRATLRTPRKRFSYFPPIVMYVTAIVQKSQARGSINYRQQVAIAPVVVFLIVPGRYIADLTATSPSETVGESPTQRIPLLLCAVDSCLWDRGATPDRLRRLIRSACSGRTAPRAGVA